MKEKIHHWIKAEKFKLLTVLLASVVNILVLIPTYFIEKYINTGFLIFGVGTLFFFLVKECKKTKQISIVYLFGVNVISLINFLWSYNIIFNSYLLWIRAILFLAVVISGLIIAWKGKKGLEQQFIGYLIISLLTVVLNFGGFYEALYSMYFPYELEGFKIEQEMSYSQAITPMDFIYYSGDAFFGTDISDVRIRYIDYTQLNNQESIMSKYVDKYESATKIIQLAKLVSFIESILFIVYISILVMGVDSKKEEDDS